MSNSANIADHGKRAAAGIRRPLLQSYADVVSVFRRMLQIGDSRVSAQGSSGGKDYRLSSVRRGAKRRRRAQNPFEAPARLQTTQALSPALDAMMSQIQALAQKVEAAAQRVEEVSDKAEAAEQTALKMAELTALAATELAAFAATDQAKIIGFREAPRRRNYEYLPNMDA
ncbi:hypothetical protein CCAX7_30120 [Capsulimonas corticalis]|uniref:Uncharacterized protein n=1 Tax=Capsulimonas corticalis TaxID=2219043 RepID=A0A402CSU1_9BACT|nr:hypothetical protein [Capsulimonas corticalis]BDI30961.1 hypothetical protein CCAX7_30120 [Capsulimonas corticalis]